MPQRVLQTVSLALLVCWSGCARPPALAEPRTDPPQLAKKLAALQGTEQPRPLELEPPPQEIIHFCADCHVLPEPNSFVREVWYEEIEKGYEFYARSGRTDLQPPPLQTVLNYYRQRAPDAIEFAPPPEVDSDWRQRFEVERIDWSDNPVYSPAISSLTWIEMLPEHQWRLVATDMRDGSIHAIQASPNDSKSEFIGRVANPARVRPGDLNGDGRTDLVVADLGSFSPFDHDLGGVMCLERQSAWLEFKPWTIAQDLGRIADVSLGDFDGDGVDDVLAAEFGHRHTGGIHLLTRLAAPSAQPDQGPDTLTNDASQTVESPQQLTAYRSIKLDGRPGTIDIPVHDWNNDGRLDFAALLSQEFECIDIFLNQGSKFDRIRVTPPHDLTYGSVGMQLIDLDQDSDQDILYVNGDAFDNNFVNRSHGIQWLENLGALEFKVHRLADLPVRLPGRSRRHGWRPGPGYRGRGQLAHRCLSHLARRAIARLGNPARTGGCFGFSGPRSGTRNGTLSSPGGGRLQRRRTR